MATVAVFIALGGTTWAVAVKSVGTKQLKNNAVSGKKIKKNAVQRKHIVNGAVDASKIADGAVGATKINSDGLDSDTLDGTDGSGFLRSGQDAGGDLAGTYPNPSIKGLDPVPLTLENGWEPFGFNIRGPAAVKDPFGFVHLIGAIKKGAGATSDVFTTLPPEFTPPLRPAEQFTWLTLGGTTGASDPKDAAAELDHLTGELTAHLSGTGLSGEFINLEGATYYAGN